MEQEEVLTEEKIEETQETQEEKIEEQPTIDTSSIYKSKYLDHDIKYRGPLSYRTLKIIGYIALVFLQFTFIIPFLSNLTELPSQVYDFSFACEWIGTIGVPLLLLGTFCRILSGQKSMVQVLRFYAMASLLVYLLAVFGYNHYVVGLVKTIIQADTKTARDIALPFFCLILNGSFQFNVFIDMLLITSFYFFLMYEPKCKSRTQFILFRLCIIFPIAYFITSLVLHTLFQNEVVLLPMEVSSLLTCRSPIIYCIFVSIIVFLKVRQSLYIKKGGTKESYAEYLKTNANTLHFSLFCSLVIIVFSAIDFGLSYVPILENYGLGQTYYMILTVPFIMLLSYNRTYKDTNFDTILPILFIVVAAFVYLEVGYRVISEAIVMFMNTLSEAAAEM